MLKFIEFLISRVLLNLIPAILMYLGKFESHAKWVYDLLNIKPEILTLDIFMMILFIAGCLMIYIIYPFRFELLKRKSVEENDMLKLVVKELRQSFCKALGKELGEHNLRLNVRKYTPQPFYQKRLREWTQFDKKYFQVKNFTELCDDDISENYSFEVCPVSRGLVGITYQTKSFKYDDNLSERMDLYNLNQYHKSKSVINSTEFGIAKPVLNQKEIVKSVITFDSNQAIKIPNDEKTKKNIDKIIHYYTDLFGKIIPYLK